MQGLSHLSVLILKKPWKGSSRSLTTHVRRAMEKAVARHIASSICVLAARTNKMAKKVTKPKDSSTHLRRIREVRGFGCRLDIIARHDYTIVGVISFALTFNKASYGT